MKLRSTKVLPFIVGLLLGVLTAHFVQLGAHNRPLSRSAVLVPAPTVACKEKVTAAVLKPTAQPCPTGATPDEASVAGNVSIYDQLYRRVRILCLIMTHPGNYATKAVAVNNTWGRRCNRYVFVGSNATKLDIPLIRLNLTDSYGNLWQKTWMSLDYAARELDLNNFDFILKADDDTFVVMENLRMLLLPLDPQVPSHLGRQFYYNKDEKQQYMSGGAGYVLSRGAVRLFVKRAVQQRGGKPKACDLETRVAEDWMIGTCLTSLGVKLENSRDSAGLERFHPLNPEYMIGWGPAEMPPWMWTFNYYKFKACLRNCISSVTATFHYISNMYLMEFLLYGMRPVGVDPTVNETQRLMRNLL